MFTLELSRHSISELELDLKLPTNVLHEQNMAFIVLGPYLLFII